MTEKETSRQLLASYYTLHGEELRAYIAKGIQDYDKSQDLVQDIFCRLLSTDRLVSAVTLPSLLYTMARNKVNDYWRHRLAVIQHDTYLKSNASHDNRMEETSVYSAWEMEEILERGMARLSEKQQVVYRMNLIDGLKVSEISARLHENYKSVENRLGIARKEMRRYIIRMMA